MFPLKFTQFSFLIYFLYYIIYIIFLIYFLICLVILDSDLYLAYLYPPQKNEDAYLWRKIMFVSIRSRKVLLTWGNFIPLGKFLDSSMSLWFISPIFLLAKDSSPAVALIQAYIFKAKLLLNLFNDAFFSAYFCVFVSRWHVFISCKSRSPIKTCFMQISLFFFPSESPSQCLVCQTDRSQNLGYIILDRAGQCKVGCSRATAIPCLPLYKTSSAMLLSTTAFTTVPSV